MGALKEVFTHPGYRRLWTASALSRWGDAFHTVALPLLVLHLTGSGLGVGMVVAAEIVPVLLLAPIAGAVADRLSPLRVMICADLVRAVLVALLPLVSGHIGAVYAIAFGLSSASVFFNPATGTVLPRLVAERELVAANSGIWTAAVLSQIALAPAAGLLVVAFGFAPSFLINAASFVASALVLARLALPARPEAEADDRAVHDGPEAGSGAAPDTPRRPASSARTAAWARVAWGPVSARRRPDAPHRLMALARTAAWAGVCGGDAFPDGEGARPGVVRGTVPAPSGERQRAAARRSTSDAAPPVRGIRGGASDRANGSGAEPALG
ncbi:MFS transporter [Streptomyces sp. NPDC004976]